MAVQVASDDGTSLLVDPKFRAARISIRPGEVTGWSSFGITTSALSGLAANATVFSLRNTGSTLVAIRRLQLSWLQTVAFSAAQRIELGLYVARSWTGADSGGMGLSNVSGKHRATLNNLPIDMRAHVALAITPGSRSLDGSPVAVASLWAGGAGATLPQQSLVSTDAGDHPLLLGANEGVVLLNMFAMGLGGAGIAYLNLELAEAATY